jgi:hypothetical protein
VNNRISKTSAFVADILQGSSWGEILGRSDFLAKNREKGNNPMCVCINMHGYTSFNYNINTMNLFISYL